MRNSPLRSRSQTRANFKWSSIGYYIGLLIFSSFVVYIPLVIFFPEIVNIRKQSFRDIQSGYFWFTILSVSISLLAASFTTYYSVKNDRSLLSAFGLTFRLKSLLIGLLIGAATMVTFVLACLGFGSIELSFNGIGVSLLLSLLLYFLVAVSEEIIIRGYLLFKFRQRFGDFSALIITSTLFGLMHLANDHFTWLGFANISLSGFLMGLVVLRTGSISSAIGMHWAWNFIQGPVFGFAVSGHGETGILSPKAISMPLLTGGEFGAEGSLILIPITLIFIFLIYKHLKPTLE